MSLAHSTLVSPDAAPDAYVLFLHGLLGQGSNWQGFARRLCAERPELGALLFDLRMHGASQALPPPHTLANAARDVRDVLLQPELRGRAVVGHSFGGKLAMLLLADPPPALQEVWVLDASPSARGPRPADDVTRRVVEALGQLPERIESRAQFSAELDARGVPASLVPWLAKNLQRDGDALRFGLDLGAIRELFADHDRTGLWPLVESPPPGVALRFVLGGRSTTVSPADRARLYAAAARGVLELHELPDAGHFVHVDDPDGLLALLAARLLRAGW